MRTVVLVDEATGTPGIKTVNLRFNAPFLENISASGYDTRVARSTGTLNIRTVAPAEYDHEIKRRPMTLREISDKNPQNMKKRGFFELSGKFDSDDGKITFVNVLTTDTGRLNTLDERIYSDHTVVAYGERNICINTTLGKRYREGSVETDALVFSEIKNGFVALRAQHVSLQGMPVISVDRPVSIEFRNGAIKTFSYCS